MYNKQQRVSSTEQSRCVHVLLRLISMVATHIHDEEQELPGCNCDEPQYPCTVATAQVVEHTSNARNLVIAELLLVDWAPIAQHSSDAGQSPSELVASLCALCREGQSPQTARGRARSNPGKCPRGVCVEHVDAELVNACSELEAEQWVTAMQHGTLRRPPKQQNDRKFEETLELHDIGHLGRRFQAVICTQAQWRVPMSRTSLSFFPRIQ